MMGAFVAALPLPYRYGNLILIPLLLYWLAAGRYKNTLPLIKESAVIKLFVLFFGIVLLSIVTSENFNYRFSFIERYLGLLVFPLIFSSFQLTTNDVSKLLKIFVVSCSVCAIYSLISTFIVYEMTPADLSIEENFGYFSWILPETLNLKSNYYSWFVAFCLIIIVEIIFQTPKRHVQILWLILFCFLFVFLGVLSSRTSFIAAVLILVIYFARLAIQHKFRVGKSLIIGIVVIGLALVSLQSPFLKAKIGGVITGGGQSDPRYILFQCGWQIFSENVLFGTGICDVEDLALSCYKTFNDVEAIEKEYNFHNVFIQVGASMGIIGLTILIALIIAIILRAKEVGRLTHIGFIVLFCFACTTESLLTRNKGISFFSTFSALLFILKPHEENTTC